MDGREEIVLPGRWGRACGVTSFRKQGRSVEEQSCLGGFNEQVGSGACFFHVFFFHSSSFLLILVHGGWVYWWWATDECVRFFSFRMFY